MKLVFIAGENISTTLLWPTCHIKNLSCKSDTALTIYLQALNVYDRETWLAFWEPHLAVILCEKPALIDLRIVSSLWKITCNQPQALMAILSWNSILDRRWQAHSWPRILNLLVLRADPLTILCIECEGGHLNDQNLGIYPSHGVADKKGEVAFLDLNCRLPAKLRWDPQAKNTTTVGLDPLGGDQWFLLMWKPKRTEDKNGGESHANLPEDKC